MFKKSPLPLGKGWGEGVPLSCMARHPRQPIAFQFKWFGRQQSVIPAGAGIQTPVTCRLDHLIQNPGSAAGAIAKTATATL